MILPLRTLGLAPIISIQTPGQQPALPLVSNNVAALWVGANPHPSRRGLESRDQPQAAASGEPLSARTPVKPYVAIKLVGLGECGRCFGIDQLIHVLHRCQVRIATQEKTLLAHNRPVRLVEV